MNNNTLILLVVGAVVVLFLFMQSRRENYPPCIVSSCVSAVTGAAFPANSSECRECSDCVNAEGAITTTQMSENDGYGTYYWTNIGCNMSGQNVGPDFAGPVKPFRPTIDIADMPKLR